MRYALLFALTLLAPALYADGDLAFVPDDIDVTPDVATPVKPPHKPHLNKPKAEAPPAKKPASPKPHAEAPAATVEPVAPPAPHAVRARPAAALSPAAKPRPVAWSTPYKCSVGTTNRMNIAGDIVQHSLGFRNVYSETLVAQDRRTSFQIARDNDGGLQVIVSTYGMTFNAPATVCEQQPGVLVASIIGKQRVDCLPVELCGFAASRLDQTYTVQLSRPQQPGNSIVVSGDGLTPGIYTGQPSAAR